MKGLTSLQLPKKLKRKPDDGLVKASNPVESTPRYPSGTELRFGSEYDYDDHYEINIDKIPGLNNLDAEDKVEITGVGIVTRKTIRDHLGQDGKVKKGKSISIQVTDIAVKKVKDVKNMNMKEYREMRKADGVKVY